MYIENIVIGKPIIDERLMFALDDKDWENVEKPKTIWTQERNLAKIMKDIGIVKSVSEVKRNKPQYCVFLEDLDFLEIKWGKRRLFVLVGRDTKQ